MLKSTNKRIIVTGGCGFIGHHFIEHIYKNTNWDIIVIDKLTYASSLSSLKEIQDNVNYKFIKGDIIDILKQFII